MNQKLTVPENLQKLSIVEVIEKFKIYLNDVLRDQELINDLANQTFCIWRMGRKELFWNVVKSENFEEDARRAVALNVVKQPDWDKTEIDIEVDNYMPGIRMFRDFVMARGTMEIECENKKIFPVYGAPDIKFDIPKFTFNQIEESVSTSIESNKSDVAWLQMIESYLKRKGKLYDSYIENRVKARLSGKKFALSEHIQGMIYSLLSGNTEWARIAPHLKEIDQIFFNYDANKILQYESTYFEKRVKATISGQRFIKRQMEGLNYNIELFLEIEDLYGSMDDYVTSAPTLEILNDFAKGRYKLKNMRVPLCWEYLRNVGIDGAKPDVHLCRFLGSDRMGPENQPLATEDEVYSTVTKLSEKTGYLMASIDNIIWSFCANKYGEICTAEPKCYMCPIKNYCKKGNRL